MRIIKFRPLVSVIALASGSAAVAVSPAAMAGYGLKNVDMANVDTSRWACKYCPDESSTAGHVAVGVGYSDEDASARFKNSPADGDGVQGDVDAAVRNYGDYGQSRVSAYQLGLDNASAEAGVSLNIGLDASVDYSSSKLYSDEGARTAFVNPGSDTLALPSGWTTQSSTDAMDLSSMQEVTSFKKRDNLTATAKQVFGEDILQASAKYRRVNRVSDDWRSGSILNDVTALPGSRDDSIEEFTLGGAVPFTLYSGAGSVGVEFFESRYESESQSQSWQNPFAAGIAGADKGRMAAEPENTFQQWRLFGDYAVDAHRFLLSASQGKGEQDQAYLPYTSNEQLTTSALPKTNYEGEVETSNFRLGWNYLINSQFRLSANYRFDERVNDSEVMTYQPVMTDSLIKGAIDNTIYSHEKNVFDLALEWRWRPSSRFFYEYAYEGFERTSDNPGEAKTHELAFGWRERWTRSVTSELAISVAERNSDEPDMMPETGENPYFRDFTLADRIRNKVSMDIAWQYTDGAQLRAEASYLDDDYENTVIGVTAGAEADVSLGMDWQLTQSLGTSLTWQRSWYSWEMHGSSQQTIPTWQSKQHDNADAIILGLNHAGFLQDKLHLGLDYVFVTASGKTNVSVPGGHEKLTSDSHTVQAYMNYSVTPQWNVRLEALFEHFDESDWQTIDVDTVPSILASGAKDEDYQDWLVGMKVSYLIK